jgi:hypothetical protein
LFHFKLKVEPESKKLIISFEWSKKLEDLNITTPVKSAVISRHKGKYRVSILDSRNFLTSVGRDGKFDDFMVLSPDVVKIKST